MPPNSQHQGFSTASNFSSVNSSKSKSTKPLTRIHTIPTNNRPRARYQIHKSNRVRPAQRRTSQTILNRWKTFFRWKCCNAKSSYCQTVWSTTLIIRRSMKECRGSRLKGVRGGCLLMRVFMAWLIRRRWGKRRRRWGRRRSWSWRGRRRR